MRKLKFAGLITAVALVALTLSGQELGYTWSTNALHVTTNNTVTILGDSRLVDLVICVSDAGTGWTITVKNKDTTPKILGTFVTASGVGTYNKVNLTNGVLMAGGIDVVSSGGTPGVADIYITRRGGVTQSPTPTATPSATATATATATPTPE